MIRLQDLVKSLCLVERSKSCKRFCYLCYKYHCAVEELNVSKHGKSPKLKAMFLVPVGPEADEFHTLLKKYGKIRMRRFSRGPRAGRTAQHTRKINATSFAYYQASPIKKKR